MKRILLALLLALCLLPLPAFGESVSAEFRSDFSAGPDGWYARSDGSAAVTTTAEGSLAVTSRSADWHSPGRDFALVPGESYLLSVQVRQRVRSSATFILSVAHTLNGEESYENLGSGTAKRGKWTEITGSYTAGAFDRFVLYVETAGAADLPFEIKDFTVKKGTVVFGEAEIPSLKDLYADAFDFGAAVTRSEAASYARMAFYGSQFNIVTPGNEMKPDFLLDMNACRTLAREDDTAVAVHFDAAADMLNWAQTHGVKVHGHVFVWHQQTPEAFFHAGYNLSQPLVSREVMLARLDHFMEAVFTELEARWPGVVVSYDVANEVIDDGTGKLRDSRWLEIVGEDYVARAFELARKHAPAGVRLFYNDYNTAYQPKLRGIRDLLLSLQAEGNIDGYGFQMHHSIRTPTLAQIKTAVETIAATGLRLRVSELDITVPDNSAAAFQRQADLYGGIMQVLLAHREQIDAVQVWGVTDDLSWRASGYPLLFDGQANPKPAFWALVNLAPAAE